MNARLFLMTGFAAMSKQRAIAAKPVMRKSRAFIAILQWPMLGGRNRSVKLEAGVVPGVPGVIHLAGVLPKSNCSLLRGVNSALVPRRIGIHGKTSTPPRKRKTTAAPPHGIGSDTG